MFTSAVDGEGKSTTVANLALAFAQAGNQVVLVDLDFRNASLHRLFGLPAQPGLIEAVHGLVPLNAASANVELSYEPKAAGEAVGGPGGTLRVMPLGLQRHGSEGSHAVSLEEVLEKLARDADLVLIDSPSLLESADAVALTAYADALVVVANPRALPVATLDEVRRVLDESPGSNVLGYVATGEPLEKGHGRISAVRGRASQVGRFLASLTLRLRPGRLPLVSHGDSHR
jgi:Mrp family chromosome partitioning ATPase